MNNITNNTNEVWMPIDDFPWYLISSFGNVMSIARTITIIPNKPGFKCWSKRYEDKILIPETTKKGYLRVTLCNGEVHKRFLVHRLVASAFLNKEDGLPEVNHIDENQANNRVYNLEWCTKKYNRMHGTGHQRRINSKSINVDQFDLSGVFLKRWKSAKTAELDLCVTKGKICNCCKGIRKTTHGFIWSYSNLENNE